MPSNSIRVFDVLASVKNRLPAHFTVTKTFAPVHCYDLRSFRNVCEFIALPAPHYLPRNHDSFFLVVVVYARNTRRARFATMRLALLAAAILSCLAHINHLLSC